MIRVRPFSARVCVNVLIVVLVVLFVLRDRRSRGRVVAKPLRARHTMLKLPSIEVCSVSAVLLLCASCVSVLWHKALVLSGWFRRRCRAVSVVTVCVARGRLGLRLVLSLVSVCLSRGLVVLMWLCPCTVLVSVKCSCVVIVGRLEKCVLTVAAVDVSVLFSAGLALSVQGLECLKTLSRKVPTCLALVVVVWVLVVCLTVTLVVAVTVVRVILVSLMFSVRWWTNPCVWHSVELGRVVIGWLLS